MSDEVCKQKLFSLRNKFLCCFPISEINLEESLLELSYEDQEYLWNETIYNELLKKYPIKPTYQKYFTKICLNILENSNIEVSDVLYERNVELLSAEDCETYYYKHYIVDGTVITLKENKSVISEGTTGLCSWQASIALSQWCLINKQKFAGKTVLELGSGCGLVGLTAIFHCQPNSFYLTDCHPSVLQVLKENIVLNIEDPSSSELIDFVSCGKNTIKKTIGNSTDSSDNAVTVKKTSLNSYSDSDGENELKTSPIIFRTVKDSCDIFVVDLPWESVEENKEYKCIQPDLVLAADVVYDSSVFKPLCDSVNFYLNLNRDKKCEVVFACTERNSDTLEQFLGLLESKDFCVSEFPAPTCEDFFWSTAVPIRFFSVSL